MGVGPRFADFLVLLIPPLLIDARISQLDPIPVVLAQGQLFEGAGVCLSSWGECKRGGQGNDERATEHVQHHGWSPVQARSPVLNIANARRRDCDGHHKIALLLLCAPSPLGRAVQRTGVVVGIPILSRLHHHYARI